MGGSATRIGHPRYRGGHHCSGTWTYRYPSSPPFPASCRFAWHVIGRHELDLARHAYPQGKSFIPCQSRNLCCGGHERSEPLLCRTTEATGVDNIEDLRAWALPGMDFRGVQRRSQEERISQRAPAEIPLICLHDVGTGGLRNWERWLDWPLSTPLVI